MYNQGFPESVGRSIFIQDFVSRIKMCLEEVGQVFRIGCIRYYRKWFTIEEYTGITRYSLPS